MKNSLTIRADRAKSQRRQVLPVERIHGMKMLESDLRIGAVSYLNSKPLIEGLSELLPHTNLRLDFPSRLADDLKNGDLDVALIPSIEFFRGNHYHIVSDACVAAHGPVLSVKLYSRVPWGRIQTLALDAGSRTSATLARILLAERHGVFPILEPLPLDHRTEDTSADAILLIGDRAISPPKEKFPGIWDLGQEWFEWTGLPFVFAMWVANDDRLCRFSPVAEHQKFGVDPEAPSRPAIGAKSKFTEFADTDLLAQRLSQARNWGVARLTEIAEREAPLLGLSFPTTYSYLSENLQYDLGNAERMGLKLFYELAAGIGLAPRGVEVRFHSAPD